LSKLNIKANPVAGKFGGLFLSELESFRSLYLTHVEYKLSLKISNFNFLLPTPSPLSHSHLGVLPDHGAGVWGGL